MKNSLMVSTAASALMAVMAMGAPAMAQDTTAAPATAQNAAKPTTDTTEVTVIGIRKSLRDALQTKRAATGVVEVISSKDIGALPDVSIAETLNTVPGVNTSRDRGNDSQASIGGQGPRLVLGLINGREMASSEPDRNVRWEIFPSEIVSGVQIYKTSEANLATGGISGTIDVQTIRPLDYSGSALTLRAGPVLYDGGNAYPGFKGLGDRFSGAYVAKLSRTLGFVIAGTYQDQKNGYEDVQGGGWNYGPGNDPGAIVAGGPAVASPWGASWEGKNIDTVRASVSSSLQWKPSDIFEGRIDALYSSERISEEDNGAWISGWGNWGGYETGDFSNTVVKDGALVKADVSAASGATINPEVAEYRQDMKLLATGANGKWNLGDWQAVGDLAYSQAERYGLWHSLAFDSNIGASSFDYQGVPAVTVQIDPYTAAKNGTLYAQDANGAVSHLRDTLETAKFDVNHDLSSGFLTAIKFGVSASHRVKDDAGGGATTTGSGQATNSLSLPGNGELSPLSYTTPVAASWFTPFNYKKLTAPTMLAGNYNAMVAAIYGSAVAAALSPDYKDTPFTSHVDENVFDAYGQALYETTLGGKPLTGDFGVHVTHASTDSHAPSNGTQVSIGENYTKVLPSFNAKWEIDDGVYIKSGLAEVLSRPALNDLRADRTYSLPTGTGAGAQQGSGGGGNPLLKPYTAEQFNLTYENYFHKDGLFSVNTYVKRIHDYIGYDTRTVTLPGVTLPINFTSPFNATKPGDLEGVEFIFRTPFYFIPNFDKFGIDSNLSFVNTDIHENSPAGHPFLMNGVAKTSGSLELYYADSKFETRLGLKYHSPYTMLYGWDASGSGLSAIRAETILDYSASYNISKQLTVRFQAGNLLNTALRTYDYNDPVFSDRNDYYGRRYQVDLTYRY